MASTTTLTVALLIVSTTASRDPTTDASGQLLRDLLLAASTTPALTWEVTETLIVPDDTQAIQDAVVRWADVEKVNLVVTTGGTGFAISDGTPEAVRPLLGKEAPGLVHAMLSTSLKITPYAMMARPVAGVRAHTLIVTLPGSPKGAKENLSCLLPLLPHACIQCSGLTSSRALHSGGTPALEARSGLPPSSSTPSTHHHHHHDHPTPRAHTANTLNGPVTSRHRASPYPLLTVSAATALIAAETTPTDIVPRPVGPSLVGHILAEDVTAPHPIPAFRASIVDGYAVVHTDGPGVYPVVSVSHASPATPTAPLLPGQAARITTGAPLPAGATAVVMVEDTELVRATPDSSEELEVRILASDLRPGENIREIGSDVAEGTVVLPRGSAISAVGGEIGLLASVGRRDVRVRRKPVVAVLSTGDEVVPHDREGVLRAGEIRDTNRPALLSAIAASGFPTVDLGIVADAAGELERVLRAGLEGADVVVTTGGVSMGELDLLKPTVEQALGGSVVFGRVAMKPGKPTTFATVPVAVPGSKEGEEKKKKKLLFALPGNPASAIVTYHLFVLPALRAMVGMVPAGLPVVRVVLQEDVRLDERPEYHRVRIAAGGGDDGDGRLRAWSTGGQRSSRVGSAGGANGVLVLPARGECGLKVELLSGIRTRYPLSS
ncbi:hypothetical protein P167DRAFT_564638 [Morchella conica CCBAS932]|uniref:MoaB/Mog domain-containing protein n=1 Tax=Morchella conica CCBAS932 TaxID=1392247 RepID=A0A3N4KUD1_9PEZI|nr:hypothetical protein P167DRAFT_564638 [Morchella conica CCBAS932]